MARKRKQKPVLEINQPKSTRAYDPADWTWYEKQDQSFTRFRPDYQMIAGAVENMLKSYPKNLSPVSRRVLNYQGRRRFETVMSYLRVGFHNIDFPKKRPVVLVTTWYGLHMNVQTLRKGSGYPILIFIKDWGYPTVVWP